MVDFLVGIAPATLAVLMGFLAGCAFMGSLMRRLCESAIEQARQDERAKAVAWGRGLIEQGEREMDRVSRRVIRSL